jgi:NAD(P)-dependent dehydrogenase (short-subunit alcohol dehydrogenase family)
MSKARSVRALGNISLLAGARGLICCPALVTGGGTGIGKSIAAALALNGAKVYIAARKEKLLKEASSSYIHNNIAKAHPSALLLLCRQLKSLIAWARAKWTTSSQT